MANATHQPSSEREAQKEPNRVAVGYKRWLHLIGISIREMIDTVEYWHLAQLKWINTL